MKIDYPCKDCSDRCLGCHSECEKYKEASKKNEALRDKRHRQDYLYGLVVSMRRDSIAKVCRGRRM